MSRIGTDRTTENFIKWSAVFFIVLNMPILFYCLFTGKTWWFVVFVIITFLLVKIAFLNGDNG